MPDMINSIIVNAIKSVHESPCVELKENNFNPELIGEYISALSNTAALFNREHAFVIWGVNDSTHKIVGTTFDPQKEKVGNQGLELWLTQHLTPQIQFYFHKTVIDGCNLVLLEINRATTNPVQFNNIEYIRIDSYKKKLKDFPDMERELWAIFSQKPFETLIAMENISADMALRMVDYASYFEMLSLDLPSDKQGVINALLDEGILSKHETGNYNVTNLGAILFAKRLSDFPALERKAIRVIKYEGVDRISSASKEQVGVKGYANGFQGLIEYINNLFLL